jgi:hypothetical protein
MLPCGERSADVDERLAGACPGVKGAQMSARHAGYHAFGAFAGLVTSGMAGVVFTGTSPAPPPIRPCDMAPVSSSAAAPAGTPVSGSPTTSSAPLGNPSPSSAVLSPSAVLCLQAQALPGTPVQVGQSIPYAIWIWFAGGVTGNATVGVAAGPGRLSPVFAVCPLPGTATCSTTVSGSPTELVARLTVPPQDAGVLLTLTATATSPQASLPATTWASVRVSAPPTPTPVASTPAPGVGGTVPPPTLPPGTLPGAVAPATLPLGVPTAAALPTLPAPVTSPGVVPAFAPSPAIAQPIVPLQAANVSAQLPLSAHAIGGQIIGLAALAAATTIAIARLTLRKRQP